MTFLKEGKTNWKYILIVVILAFFVGGGILSSIWLFRIELAPVVEIITKDKLKNSVLILATDKTEYDINEAIEITLENRGDVTVFYSMDSCGCAMKPELYLESFENGEWDIATIVQVRLCHTGPCLANLEIKPGEVINIKSPFEPVPGLYRFSVSTAGDCPTDSPCTDIRDVYSNEFIIKRQPELIKDFKGTVALGNSPSCYEDILAFKSEDGVFYDILGERSMENNFRNFQDKKVIIQGYLIEDEIYRGACTGCVLWNEEEGCIDKFRIEKSIFVIDIEATE